MYKDNTHLNLSTEIDMTKYNTEYAQQYHWSSKVISDLYYTIFMDGVAVISTYEDLYDDYYMRSKGMLTI